MRLEELQRTNDVPRLKRRSVTPITLDRQLLMSLTCDLHDRRSTADRLADTPNDGRTPTTAPRPRRAASDEDEEAGGARPSVLMATRTCADREQDGSTMPTFSPNPEQAPGDLTLTSPRPERVEDADEPGELPGW
jgi:hypothetical protein